MPHKLLMLLAAIIMGKNSMMLLIGIMPIMVSLLINLIPNYLMTLYIATLPMENQFMHSALIILTHQMMGMLLLYVVAISATVSYTIAS